MAAPVPLRKDRVHDNQVEPKPRKIRKGTLSCWECKRRKIRCCFLRATDSVCQSCRSRKTQCISQAHPEKCSKPDNIKALPYRIARLELVVESLVKAVGHSDYSEPSISCAIDAEPLHRKTRDTSIQPYRSGLSDHDSLRSRLLQAWPKNCEIGAILTCQGELSGLFHATTFTPSFDARVQLSLEERLRLPCPQAHPVLVARKLLVLTAYLQSLSSTCVRRLNAVHVDPHAIMVSAVETVHRYITSNDALLESVEGLECLLIEGMYHSNSGDFRGAWHLSSRAVLIAQMMNLHQRPTFESVKILDDETRTRVDLEYLWFCLIRSNRYLSMMLGMQASTSNNDFSDQYVLRGCTPTERLQRLQCAAGGYLLQRNTARQYDFGTTKMIDQMLQDSIATLPSTWWQLPDFESTLHNNDTKSLEDISRTMDQLTHYHLLIQLHLPHLVNPPTQIGTQYEYSKVTAIHASREILSRFSLLHSNHAFASHCRGISFLAFIACTTLCISQLEAKSRLQSSTFDINNNIFPSLLSTRQQDVALMVQSLNSLKHIATSSSDTIASKTSGILTHLLDIEADATSFGALDSSEVSSPKIKPGFGCGGKLSNDGQTLYIHFPVIGTLKFERSRLYRGLSVGYMQVPFARAISALGQRRPGLPLTKTGSDIDAFDALEDEKCMPQAHSLCPSPRDRHNYFPLDGKDRCYSSFWTFM